MGRIFGTSNTTSRAGTRGADLSTTEGLLKVAEQHGLRKRAEKILQKGESPKEIYSGGFISDVFDTLNLLQYGVVGVLKGKGFKEGIEKRMSFTDKDMLGDKGIPGMIAGIALDIAVDPLTYIAPYSVIKKIPMVSDLFKTATKVAKEKKVVQNAVDFLGSRFVYRFGLDPVYKKLDDLRIRNIAVAQNKIMELAEPLRKLDPELRNLLTKTDESGATIRKTEEEIRGVLKNLPKEKAEKVRKSYMELSDTIDRYTREYVKLGLLPEDVYKNLNKYLRNRFRAFEVEEKAIKKLFPSKKVRIDITQFKKRKDIPEEIREQLGQIFDAGYLLPHTAANMVQTIENAKFFNKIESKFARDLSEVEKLLPKSEKFFDAKEKVINGYKKLPDSKALGALAGKYVPKHIADSVNEIVDLMRPNNKFTKKIVAGFKFGKVILNPATHIRNVISNEILNHMTGLPIYRQDIYAKALKEMTTKGKLYKEARKVGLGLNTFATNELKALLTQGEALSKLDKLGIKAKELAEKISNIYQKEEEFAKMAMYIYQKGKGLSPEDAMKLAEKATFDYSAVTPFIRRLRESLFGFPFITFTYKATPLAVETIVKAPSRISWIGKIKQGIENQADLKELEAERATEPDWIKDGFFIKLPIKDKYGRSAYFDMTYILPFGDLVSGQLIQRQRGRETGILESYPSGALRLNPTLNFIKEISRNQDFYGNKIWKESDPTEKQLADLFRHLLKTYAPPLISEQISGGYRSTGERRLGTLERLLSQRFGIESSGYIGRTPVEELFRNVGLKINPVDLAIQKKIADAQNRKALQTLLGEAAITKTFKRPYLNGSGRIFKGKGRINIQ